VNGVAGKIGTWIDFKTGYVAAQLSEKCIA
jgi:hypothetical protein